MSSLSIRHMNFTLQQREHERARKDAEWYASLPEDERSQKFYYWHIKQRTKRSWKFYCDFYGSEAAMAAFWLKRFGTKPNFRLRCFDLTPHLTQNHSEGQS